MKRQFLLIIGVLFSYGAWAQSSTSATVSYVLGLGANMTCTTSCNAHTGHCTTTSTEQDGFMAMSYSPNSNSLTNATTWTTNPCAPTWFPGYANQPSSGQKVQIYGSSIAYNPADQKEYFFTYEDTTIGGVSTTNTYMFSWPVGTCPTTAQVPVEFKNTYLLAAFDNSGNSWAVNFSTTAPYSLTLQKITIVGSVITLGPNDPIVTTGGTPISTNNADDIFTTGGTFFLVADNKEYAIGYNAYSNTTTVNITGTYVGPIGAPAGDYVVGLAYAGGTMVGAVYTTGTSCTPVYDDINMITGGTTAITYTGGFNSTDLSDVTSGVGAAKSLVSVTATGVPNEYTVVYDVFVQNFGNYPVHYIQATDNLANIHGAANVKSVSLAWAGTPPPAAYGINLNPAYAGTTSTNDSLLVSGGILYNYPVANDDFTIQITVVLDNIQSGVIYDNTAVAEGVGLAGDQLTDTSTNGNNPDLNDNGKPDDPGEDIPTPFLISITPTSAACTVLPTVLFNENFGAGSSSLSTALPGGGTSQYTGTTTSPVATNDYTVTKNANNGNGPNWISLADHTTGTGNMMLVNADLGQNIVYQAKVSNLCSNLKYSFNAWVANISDTAAITFCNAVGGYQPPNLTFQLYDSNAAIVVANLSTGPIWNHTWASYGMREPLPTQSTGTVYLQIINNGGGGCGNDFALDDISFGLCDPLPTVVVDGSHAGCFDSTTILKVVLGDTTVFGSDTLVYQWQDSVAGGHWTDINALNPVVGITTGSQNDSLIINPVTAANANRYYRVNVASTGNSEKPCSYWSPGFLISLKASSTPPLTVTGTPSLTEGCSEVPITLTENGGFLGDGATWVWYTGGCGTGTSIGSGTSITVEPTVTTAYFVRAEGACNTTSCAATAITVTCALPTDLIYFHGSYSSGIATLTWEVSDNDNLNGFYVERSLDGVTFTRVDSVSATADAGDASYSWADNVASLHTQTISYRIILRFKTGDLKPSSVVAINKPLDLTDNLVVYPNPASNQLTIAVNSDKEQQLSYVLINMQGQVLLTGSQTLSRGANSVNVNGLQVAASGAYILRIQTQDYVVQKKILIQK